MMPTKNLWVKTHKALNEFYQNLTCPKCQEIFNEPKQFLNCGHFACTKCIGKKTECIQCKIPGKASDICVDQNLQDLLLNLRTITESVGLSLENINLNNNSVSSMVSSREKNNSKKDLVKKIGNKRNKSKKLNTTVNTSICESTTSKFNFTNKINESLKNINKKNKKGETALHTASRSNIEDRVRALLDAGANPNTKDFAGWTPLQEATSFKLYNICEILLKAGALPDMPGYDNRRALHEAVLNDDYDLASLLINSNASKNVFDNVGKKPENYCKSNKMANLFKNSRNLGDNQSDKVSDLHTSLNLDKSYQLGEVEKIVLYGSDLNQKNRKDLLSLGNEKKLKICNTFSSSVTHVIIEATEVNYIKTTFDILLTILHGKWLISSDCLFILKESSNVTVEDLCLFEINPPSLNDGLVRARENIEKQNPKLFNNCYFYFAIKNYDSIEFENMKVTRESLVKLVEAGDGISLKREPKPEDIQGTLSPFHVAHNSEHSLHKCTHYIIYFDLKSYANKIHYDLPFLKTLPFMWFVESILNFKLLDPIQLGLSSR